MCNYLGFLSSFEGITSTCIHICTHKGWAIDIKGSGLTDMKCDSLLINHFAHFAAMANFTLYHTVF